MPNLPANLTPSMPRASRKLMLLGMILTAASLTACARADKPVATACPLPPVLPANLRALPPEATAPIEQMILDVASGT